MRLFSLEIVTPERVVFRGEAFSARFPAPEGSLGVLAGHAPLRALLETGIVKVKAAAGDREFTVSGGFLEVTPKGVIVIADAAEDVKDVDANRARAALERAKERVREAAHAKKDIDVDRAQRALARALNRLKAGQGE